MSAPRGTAYRIFYEKDRSKKTPPGKCYRKCLSVINGDLGKKSKAEMHRQPGKVSALFIQATV